MSELEESESRFFVGLFFALIFSAPLWVMVAALLGWL